jgi:hypothetical protein
VYQNQAYATMHVFIAKTRKKVNVAFVVEGRNL